MTPDRNESADPNTQPAPGLALDEKKFLVSAELLMEDEKIEGLEDLEFLLEEIENKIAPLA